MIDTVFNKLSENLPDISEQQIKHAEDELKTNEVTCDNIQSVHIMVFHVFMLCYQPSYCYLFSAALTELVYWSDNNQSPHHGVNGYGEFPKAAFNRKITMFINNNLFRVYANWTSKGGGTQNAHEITTIKEIGERSGEEVGLQMKTALVGRQVRMAVER